jgi:hypothetical protein
MSKKHYCIPIIPSIIEKGNVDFIQAKKNSHKQDKLFFMNKYKL